MSSISRLIHWLSAKWHSITIVGSPSRADGGQARRMRLSTRALRLEQLEARQLLSITTDSLSAGVLTVNFNGADNVAITSSGGNVLVNGAAPTGGGTASSVTAIDIAGTGNFDNVIDLSGVGSAHGFGSLASVSVNVGGSSSGDQVKLGALNASGAVSVTGSGTDAVTLANPLVAGSLSISATSISLESVTTTGNQSYSGPITLTGAVTLNAGSGNITCSSTIDSGSSFTLNSSGQIALEGAIGASTSLSSMTVNGGGTTTLAGGTIKTTFGITFNNPVLLGSDMNISNSGFALAFNSTVDGAYNLNVGQAGFPGTTFAAAVGSKTPLASLTSNGGTFAVLSLASVTTTGTQSYSDPTVELDGTYTTSNGAFSIANSTVLEGNTTISTGSGGISLNTIASNANTSFALSLNSSSSILLNSPVGSVDALSSLTVGGGGALTPPSGMITTVGNQIYNTPISFFTLPTLSSFTGAVTLNGAVSGGTLQVFAGTNITVNANMSLVFLDMIAATSGTGTLSFGPGVQIDAQVQSYHATSGLGSTATVDALTNAPAFRNAAGTATVPVFTIVQDANIADSSLPNPFQFGGTVPTDYTFGSGNTATLNTPAKFTGASTVTVVAGILSVNAVLTGANVGVVNQTGVTISGSLTAADVSVQAYSGNLGFGSGTTIKADTQSYDADGVSGSSFVADMVTNAPIFKNSAGTGAPSSFTIEQGAAIADATTPAASQFGSGIPANYSLIAANGGATLATAGKFAGANLTVSATGNVNINAGLNLASLAVTAPTATLNAASLTSTGSISLNAALLLGQNTAISGSNVSLGTVDGAHALTVGSTIGSLGVVGGNTPLTSFIAAALTLSNPITTSGTQTYNGPVTLAQDVTLTGGSGIVTFNSTIDGNQSLTVNDSGTTTFGGSIGSTTALATLITDAAGTTVLSAPLIQGNTLTFNDPVELENNVTLSVGTGALNFNNTIDGPYNLTTSNVWNLTMLGAIGSQTPLSSVDLDGTFTDLFSGGSITTTGSQTLSSGFAGFTIGANTTLTSTSGPINTPDAVNGVVNTAYALTINTGGTLSMSEAGTDRVIGSLTTNAAGGALLNGDFDTTGAQTYNNPVAPGAFATFNASSITFGSTIDGGGITVNSPGTITFDGAIGATNVLNGVTTNGGGATVLAGGSINTVFGVTLNNPVTLASNMVLGATGDLVIFNSTIDGPYNLTVGSLGHNASTFNGAVGLTTALASLTTNSPTSLESVTTTGTQSYSGGTVQLNGTYTSSAGQFSIANGAVLDGNTTISAASGVTLNTVDDSANNTHSLTLNSQAAITLGGVIGGTNAPASLTTGNSGTTAVNANVTTYGNQLYQNAVAKGVGVLLTSLDGQVIFTVVGKAVVLSQPSSVTAGTGFAVTVAAEDALGNLLTGYSGSIVLSLGSNPGGSTLTGTTTVAVSSGLAKFSGLMLNKVASGYALLVSSPSLMSATASGISVAPGAASQLLITAQPSTATAGIDFDLTVTAKDAEGNIATSFSGSETVALASNPGSTTLGGTLIATANSGIATFSGLSLTKAAAGYMLAVTSGTLASATSSAISVAPGTVTKLLVTATPANLTAGSTAAISVLAEDAFGNLGSNFSDSVTLSDSLGKAFFSVNPVVSFTGGLATVAATLDAAGSQTITATDSTATISATSNAILVTPGVATQLLISAQPPATVTAGAGFGFTVAAEDAFGNMATTFNGSETVSLASNLGGSTLGNTLTVSANDGMATFSNLTLNKVAGGYTLQVASGTLTSATSSAVSVTPGAATQLLITSQPPAIAVAGIGFGLAVTAEDAEGNVATGFNGSETLALASNPGASTLGGSLIVSASGGEASFAGLTLNVANLGYTLAVSSGSLTSATSGGISVTPGTPTQLIVATQPPSTVTAGAGFGFTVAAEDAFGNMATNFNGSETVSLSGTSGSTLGGTLTVLATGGVATFSGLTLSQAGTGFELSISGSALTAAVTGSVAVTPGATSQLVVSGLPTSVTAGSPFGLTVTAEDAEGNATPGFSGSETVALATQPGSGTLGGTLTLSAMGGVATDSDLTLNLAGGGYSLAVTSGTLASVTSGSIFVTPGAATQLVISTQPATTVAAGTLFGLTVAAEDAEGNLATSFNGNVSVALDANPGSSTLGGTLGTSASGGFATFSDLTLSNVGSGYTLQLSAPGLASATSSPIAVSMGMLTVDGTNSGSNDEVSLTFTDPTHFVVDNGGTPTTYSTQNNDGFVYNGPTDGFSKLVIDDTMGTYTVTQSLTGTHLQGDGFSLDLNNVSNLFIYGSSNSTATVDVPSGSGSNFFVDAVDSGYSYIADPIKGTYSELSGFGGVTVSGSGSNTYAYVYSTSNEQVVGGAGQTTFSVGGVTSTLSDFPQVYVVGAADGTDSITLDASGGTFVSTPQFSYVEGTSQGANFFVGALYAANVTAQASAGGSDTAVFYSYPHDTFSGAPGSSSLGGGTTNVVGTSVNFVAQALGFNSVSVFESGSGTDTANLTSPGSGSFFGTSTADTLTVGTSAVTVNTYFVPTGGQPTAVPATIVVTGNHDGTDQASIYDAPGNNALTASGSTATLTTSLGTLTINEFGSVTANRQNGTNDTVHQAAIDFTLQTVGNWTKV